MRQHTPTIQQFLEFVMRIPLTSDPERWANEFKAVLCELLPDVDRVSLFLNLYYDLSDRELEQMTLIKQIGGDKELPTDSFCADSPVGAVEYFRQQGELVDLYQQPDVVNFEMEEVNRFAAIYLWKKVGTVPISVETILIVHDLRALLSVLFLGVIARAAQQTSRPRAYTECLARLVEDTAITATQNRILVHMLYGYDQKTIAGMLGISVHAVKESLQRVYKRAEVKGYSELYAKYFGPGLGRKER